MIDPEIQRLNRMADSLHKIGLAKDSAFKVQMEEVLQKTRREMEERKRKELEEATKEVVERQEKEQRAKSKTKLWAFAAFLLTIAVVIFVVNRKKQQPKLPKE